MMGKAKYHEILRRQLLFNNVFPERVTKGEVKLVNRHRYEYFIVVLAFCYSFLILLGL